MQIVSEQCRNVKKLNLSVDVSVEWITWQDSFQIWSVVYWIGC